MRAVNSKGIATLIGSIIGAALGIAGGPLGLVAGVAVGAMVGYAIGHHIETKRTNRLEPIEDRLCRNREEIIQEGESLMEDDVSSLYSSMIRPGA